MSWNDVMLAAPPDRGAGPRTPSHHPLDGRGRPRYRAASRIPATYAYENRYDEDGVESESIELFDSRNPWIRQGLLGRLFATWNSEALHRQHGDVLYRTLWRHWHARRREAGDRLAGKTPEDLFTETQVYFLEKTRREQLDYLRLVEEFGSYCHYPLENGYKNGEEVLLGILGLHHQRLRDGVRDLVEGREAPESLDRLVEIRGDLAGAETHDAELAILARSFQMKIAEFDELAKAPVREAFLTFLASDASFDERIRIAGRNLPKPGTVRRLEHWVISRVLPEILGSGTLAHASDEEVERLRHLARKLAQLTAADRPEARSNAKKTRSVRKTGGRSRPS